MTYKSFEDYYKEATIKHLVLFKHGDYLISPPFCTDKCKDYSRVLIYKDGKVVWFDVDTPPATSKYNSMASIGNSVFFAPYAIWDEFNTILELDFSNNVKAKYHSIDSNVTGQFYNIASDGVTAFSAPLGYNIINFGLFIKDGVVKQIPIPPTDSLKRHMGCVFSNGNYYSPPRGETLDYDSILKFNPNTEEVTMIKVNNLPLSKRKYSDFIQVGNKLFALPFGRSGDLRYMLVLDTITDSTELVELNLPPFMKKYNVGVLLDDIIIAVPYGHKDDGDANYGLVFNTTTYEHTTFDIGQSFGGKYRFRCGIVYNNAALFFPTGTPNADIIAIDKTGTIIFRKSFPEYILGRPVEYNGLIYTLAYQVVTQAHCLITLDKDYNINFEVLF
jgi:hypothetical protein